MVEIVILTTLLSGLWFFVGYKYGRAVEKTKTFPSEKRSIFRKN